MRATEVCIKRIYRPADAIKAAAKVAAATNGVDTTGVLTTVTYGSLIEILWCDRSFWGTFKSFWICLYYDAFLVMFIEWLIYWEDRSALKSKKCKCKCEVQHKSLNTKWKQILEPHFTQNCYFYGCYKQWPTFLLLIENCRYW